MIRLDAESATPEVWAPVPDRLDQADEFALVGRLGPVSGRHGTAEEGERVSLLHEDSTEPVGRRVAFDDEWVVEVRHGQHRRRGDCVLEGEEGRGRCKVLDG
jgi:hypothetical protein